MSANNINNSSFSNAQYYPEDYQNPNLPISDQNDQNSQPNSDSLEQILQSFGYMNPEIVVQETAPFFHHYGPNCRVSFPQGSKFSFFFFKKLSKTNFFGFLKRIDAIGLQCSL